MGYKPEKSFPVSRRLALIASGWLFLPWAFFMAGWVKGEFSYPLILLMGLSLWLLFRKERGRMVHIGRKLWIVLVVVLSLWILLSGVGGFVWQNRWDHLYRNAVYADLVNRAWPVSDGSSALVYYIGYWLPAAIVGKMFGSLEIGFAVQLIYGVSGLIIALILLFNLLRRARAVYLIPFIFFSGMDIAGIILTNAPVRSDLHIELWSSLAWYESNTTLLFWVYNQTIPAWVATYLMFYCRKIAGSSAAILCLLSISAPFASVGLFPLAVYYTFEQLTRSGSLQTGLRKVFSIPFIVSLAGVIPVAAYFSLNTSSHLEITFRDQSAMEWIRALIILLLLEIGVWIPFIFDKIRKNITFYILLGTSVFCLAVRAGGSYDFSSRVALPLSFFLTLTVCRAFDERFFWSKGKQFAFYIVMSLCFVTPLLEMARTGVKTFVEPASEYRSFEVKSAFSLDYLRENFVADSITENPENRFAMKFLRYPRSSGSEK